MARSNKYASLNFNDIYEKKSSSSSAAAAHRPHSSSSSSPTIISNSRIHGHMLVMSRPTPKPISMPQPQTIPIEQNHEFQSPPEKSPSDSDSISLRPRGRTGSGPVISSNSLSSPGKPSSPLQSPLPKSDRFVPPHLRPGFVGREEKLVTDFQKGRGRGEFAGGLLHTGPENGRPKSGGGYERMGPGGEGEPVISMNRPRSSGARPRSSG
ncbi:unnamed protein product [Cuscuta campestris]|uniref:Uncharacterized protein n=2 Tax=Cuscuta sect. Cleistogrammica TaxID=1824901 RepID=A0A484K8I2_9ASTE|nr:hypothetical protein DM860_003806 [Cuscuta australis]VFQ59149.1 unnamed protein product [Cuscuta campestris]